MTRNRITTAAIGAVVVVAVAAVGYTSFVSKGTQRASSSLPASAIALQPAASQGAASQAALPSKLGDCAAESDRCACHLRVGTELLSTAFPARALEVVRGAPTDCANRDAIHGVQAEALAATGDLDEARRVANDVLSHDAQNRFARRALAIMEVNAARFPEADALLGKLIAEDANDVDSIYYAALASSRRDRYNDARQGFLRVLRANKGHVDARYNLVTLTAAAGAMAEAYHHFEELQAIAPAGDPRVASARAAVGAGAPQQQPPLILQQTGGGGPK